MFQVVILAGSSLFFVSTAIMNLVSPGKFAAQLGLQVVGVSGTNEIRAQYGGFFGAASLYGAGALAGYFPFAEALLFACLIFGGLILGRVVSLLSGEDFGAYTPVVKLLFWIDSVGCALNLAALLG